MNQSIIASILADSCDDGDIIARYSEFMQQSGDRLIHFNDTNFGSTGGKFDNRVASITVRAFACGCQKIIRAAIGSGSSMIHSNVLYPCNVSCNVSCNVPCIVPCNSSIVDFAAIYRTVDDHNTVLTTRILKVSNDSNVFYKLQIEHASGISCYIRGVPECNYNTESSIYNNVIKQEPFDTIISMALPPTIIFAGNRVDLHEITLE